MDQRTSMIMTGALDIPALRAFYEAGLGWQPWGQASETLAMYKLGTVVLVFLPAVYLAAESGIAETDRPRR